MSMKVYVDMDGVIADFEKLASVVIKKYYNVDDMQSVSKKIMWDAIRSYEDDGNDFWYDLDRIEGAKTLFDLLHVWGCDVEILTSVGTKGFDSGPQKIKWMEKHIPYDLPINIVSSSLDKATYAKSGDLLIDDRLKSIEPWRAVGGLGLLHTDMSLTLERMHHLLPLVCCSNISPSNTPYNGGC